MTSNWQGRNLHRASVTRESREESVQGLFGGLIALVLLIAIIGGRQYLRLRSDGDERRDPYPEHVEIENQADQADRPLQAAQQTGFSQLDAMLPEGPPAYTAAQLESWIPKIRAEVEAVSGRKFKRTPEVKCVTRAQLRIALGIEGSRGINVLDGLPGEHDMSTVFATGLYDPDDGTIYMMPGNLSAMMMRSGHGDAELMQMNAKLVLAHELAHALQDQHLNLNRMQEAAKNPEEAQALRATIEGHASLVEELIARRMQLVSVRSGLETRRDTSHLSAQDALIEDMFDYNDVVVELYYDKGSDFFEYNQKRGGPQLTWRILSDPPRDTSAFLDPARYWIPGKRLPEADALLAGFESNWPGLDNHERFSLGAFTLRLMYRGLGSREADRLTASIQSARALVLRSADETRFASIFVLVFDRSANTVNVARIMERVPPGLVDDVEARQRISIDKTGSRNLTTPQCDLVREIEFNASMLGGGRPQSGTVMRAAHGNVIVEITQIGDQIPNENRAALVKTIFDRIATDPPTG